MSSTPVTSENPRAQHMFSFAAFFFAAIGGILYGYDIGVLNGVLLFVQKAIPMSANQLSFLAGAVFFGGALAILVAGFLTDWVGRRRMIMVSSVIFIISVAIIYTSHSYVSLMLGRVIQGVSVGIVAIAVPLYLTEAMPTRMRGRGVTAFQLLLTFGILLASLVGLYYTPTGNWRGMFATSAIPAIIMFLGCFLLNDSPRWLAMKGRFERSLEILKKTRTNSEATEELAHIRASLEKERAFAKTGASIFQRRYMIPLILVCAVATLQQLTGVNALLQLSSVILKEAGLNSNIVTMLGTNAIMGLNFLMTIIAICLVDKLERRVMIGFGTGGMVIALVYSALVYAYALPGAEKGYLLLSGILGFIFFYSVGPGALIWAVMSELLPTRIRSRGLAIALFLNSMASFGLASLFIPLSQHVGYMGVFLICAFFAFLYFLVAVFFMPHTKGMSLEDIEEEFATRTKS